VSVTEMLRVPGMGVFYREVIDDAGNRVGWEPVAWGVIPPNGGVVTIPVHGPRSATLWHSIGDVRAALDAAFDELQPRAARALVRHLDRQPVSNESAEPSPTSTHGSSPGAGTGGDVDHRGTADGP
jgi:hypothetical protein